MLTDSSGNPELGCGAYCCGRWAQFRWPSSWKNLPILRNMSLLELIPVVLYYRYKMIFQNSLVQVLVASLLVELTT
jgi:hypothetical protein